MTTALFFFFFEPVLFFHFRRTGSFFFRQQEHIPKVVSRLPSFHFSLSISSLAPNPRGVSESRGALASSLSSPSTAAFAWSCCGGVVGARSIEKKIGIATTPSLHSSSSSSSLSPSLAHPQFLNCTGLEHFEEDSVSAFFGAKLGPRRFLAARKNAKVLD